METVLNNSNDPLKLEDEMLLVSGSMNANIMRDSIAILEHKLRNNDFNQGKITKAKFVCTELIQNVFKHGISIKEKPSYFTLSVKMNETGENSLVIRTGNGLEKEKAVILLRKLAQIQGLSPIELKEELKKGMEFNTISGNDNAGLGLLSISYRANQQLIFTSESINEVADYITLEVNI
jgi:Family of unknown function (DUF6272)